MPDLLTHYATSYLVASKLVGRRKALLVAFFGLAPDIDVFFHAHRYISHSIFLPLTLLLAAFTRRSPCWRRLFLVLALLYTLHLALDAFTAPLPLFAPLSPKAYMVHLDVVGCLDRGPSIKCSVYVEVVELAHGMDVVEGPIASTIGAMFLVAVLFYELASLLKRF